MAYQKKWFSKEDIETIKAIGAEHHLMTAVRFNYKLSTPKDMNETLARLYNQLADVKPLGTAWGCGTCALNNYKAIGKRYFESLEKRGIAEGDIAEDKAEETVTETVDNNEVQVPQE